MKKEVDLTEEKDEEEKVFKLMIENIEFWTVRRKMLLVWLRFGR